MPIYKETKIQNHSTLRQGIPPARRQYWGSCVLGKLGSDSGLGQESRGHQAKRN